MPDSQPQPQPYPSEQPGDWWDRFGDAVSSTYAESNQSLDLGAYKWWARTAYDIAAGLPAELSKEKHLVELRAALGLSPGHPSSRRGPLPPFPPGEYWRTLPWVPPVSRDYLRADAWGVPIPGLPPVPGGSSEHPERVLSWFLFKYPASEWWQPIFDAHRARGYTHFVLSWPDCRAAGFSMPFFHAMCLAVKQAGFYPHVKLASKVYDPRDQTAAQWLAALTPVITQLSGVVDEYGVWEWNLFNTPGRPTIDTFKGLGSLAHQHGASFWMHFSTEVTSWFQDKEPRGRFGFYDDLGTDVDGLDYQTDPTWDLPMLQARIVDSLWQFGIQGNRHRFRLFEDSASLQFTHDHPNEDDANLRSYIGCCTIDNVKQTDARVWGYGNGARRPDGTPL